MSGRALTLALRGTNPNLIYAICLGGSFCALQEERPVDDHLFEKYGYEGLKLDAGLTVADFEPRNPDYNF